MQNALQYASTLMHERWGGMYDLVTSTAIVDFDDDSAIARNVQDTKIMYEFYELYQVFHGGVSYTRIE